MAAPGGDEPDDLLDLWESTTQESEENREFARAEEERIGPEKAAELSNLLATIIKEDQELKRHEYDEERKTEERKRLKCLGWWQRPDFATTIERLDIFGLDGQPWIDIECFDTQDYQTSMEPAIQHIKNYITPKLHGLEFMVGITVDICNRWFRKDKDPKTGDFIGYKLRGFTKMYIVHASPRHKADLSIERCEKNPARQQQLIYRDTSNGRMEINLCKKDGTGLAHLENCLNKGKGDEAATDKHGFGGVTYIVTR